MVTVLDSTALTAFHAAIRIIFLQDILKLFALQNYQVCIKSAP